MKINAIYIAYVSWNQGGKRRPVLIIEDGEKSVTVFKITSKYANKSLKIKKKYYPIKNWEISGLKKASYIDTIRRVNLLKEDVDFKYIGELTLEDKKGLTLFLKHQL